MSRISFARTIFKQTLPVGHWRWYPEVGELAKEVLKATEYGTKPFHPNDHWADELGDIFFTINILANSTGIALDSALERVLAKYIERLMTKGTPGFGH